jgi:hypothetical protein
MAPAEYMGRYMSEWWDYAIADEIHQLAGDTAQGNALGVLVRSSKCFVGLGVIETIERITAEDDACSKNTKKVVTVRRKPGASPLLLALT